LLLGARVFRVGDGMSDIFIRREVDAGRHRRAMGWAWAAAIALGALIVAAVLHLRRASSGGEASSTVSVSPPGEPQLPVVAPAAADPAAVLLSEARTLKETDRLADARSKLYEALAAATSETVRRQIEDLLGTLNIAMVLSPHPMEEKADYIVQRGDKLATIARSHGTTIELIQRSNGLSNPDRIRIGDRLRVLKGTFTIHISKSRNELELMLNGRFFKRYPIGTGKYDRTPTGRTRVISRELHPTWWRSEGPPLPYGHPENVLGTHWLGLDIPGYGIHGTWEPETIGQHESAGCIWLLNSDIEELYTLIPIGVEVVIED